jgi:hypothetical protein
MKKRENLKRKFDEQHLEYRNHINYERHLQQYIAEYEEFDEKENEITHFFEKLTINNNELNSSSDQSNLLSLSNNFIMSSQ